MSEADQKLSMLHQTGDSRRSIGPRGYSCSVLRQQPARLPRLDFGCKSSQNRRSDTVLSVQTIFPRSRTSVPRTSDTQLSPNSSQSPTHSRSKATSKGHASGSSGPTTRYPSAGGEGSFRVALRGIAGVLLCFFHTLSTYLTCMIAVSPTEQSQCKSMQRTVWYRQLAIAGAWRRSNAGAQLLAGSGVSTLMTCLAPHVEFDSARRIRLSRSAYSRCQVGYTLGTLSQASRPSTSLACLESIYLEV